MLVDGVLAASTDVLAAVLPAEPADTPIEMFPSGALAERADTPVEMLRGGVTAAGPGPPVAIHLDVRGTTRVDALFVITIAAVLLRPRGRELHSFISQHCDLLVRGIPYAPITSNTQFHARLIRVLPHEMRFLVEKRPSKRLTRSRTKPARLAQRCRAIAAMQSTRSF